MHFYGEKLRTCGQKPRPRGLIDPAGGWRCKFIRGLNSPNPCQLAPDWYNVWMTILQRYHITPLYIVSKYAVRPLYCSDRVSVTT